MNHFCLSDFYSRTIIAIDSLMRRELPCHRQLSTLLSPDIPTGCSACSGTSTLGRIPNVNAPYIYAPPFPTGTKNSLHHWLPMCDWPQVTRSQGVLFIPPLFAGGQFYIWNLLKRNKNRTNPFCNTCWSRQMTSIWARLRSVTFPGCVQLCRRGNGR